MLFLNGSNTEVPLSNSGLTYVLYARRSAKELLDSSSLNGLYIRQLAFLTIAL